MTGAPSSSCKSEDHKFDTALDQHMMKTITDVKYVKHRPKFIVFGEREGNSPASSHPE